MTDCTQYRLPVQNNDSVKSEHDVLKINSMNGKLIQPLYCVGNQLPLLYASCFCYSIKHIIFPQCFKDLVLQYWYLCLTVLSQCHHLQCDIYTQHSIRKLCTVRQPCITLKVARVLHGRNKSTSSSSTGRTEPVVGQFSRPLTSVIRSEPQALGSVTH